MTKGLYVGVGADYNYHYGRFGGKRNFVAESDFVDLLGGDRVDYNATGLSLFVEFDTRDVLSAPQRGVYVGVQAKVRPKGMNNVGQTLWMGRLTANYYQRLWKGAILALDLRGELNSKGTPWVYNASLGSALRGYYAGRFNDLCAISLQAELRQRIYKRFGAVAWGGAANVFHNFRTFAWRETLPTYGVGLRYNVKKSVNIRLDYGFGGRDGRGKLIHGAVFSINEAF
jgi:outer membrane protein assembly factor BamA